MMEMNPNRRQAGFTLVEIMVVIVILGLLAGVGTVGVRRYLDQSKQDLAKTKCAQYEKAIEAEELRTTFSNSEEVWDSLLEAKVIKKRGDLKDPWGTEYIVKRDDDNDYIVISAGPDKSEGTEDDIGSRGLISKENDY